jgi:adenylate cyclase
MSMDPIADWLIGEGRLIGQPRPLIEGFCRRLVAAGIPVWRLRAGQRLANPLLSAWGVVWTRDGSGDQEYVITRDTLGTGAYFGSPFEHVIKHRRSLRRRLIGLDPEQDHAVLHEMAAAGGTDYLAMPLEYGDGSVQGLAVVSDRASGFDDDHLGRLEALRQPLAAALEPMAMRRSSASLLRTYLGAGPAAAVLAGAIRRGELRQIEAVILVTDLRGFTDKAERWDDEALLAALDGYFELIVEAVVAAGGDVLKFIGDKVLAIFPIEEQAVRQRCRAAVDAALEARRALIPLNRARQDHGLEALDFGTALHLGRVTYGNIGSRERLDFTVIGRAVNLASRIQDLCKTLGEPVLCTGEVARCIEPRPASVGMHPIRGLATPIELFALRPDGDAAGERSTTGGRPALR